MLFYSCRCHLVVFNSVPHNKLLKSLLKRPQLFSQGGKKENIITKYLSNPYVCILFMLAFILISVPCSTYVKISSCFLLLKNRDYDGKICLIFLNLDHRFMIGENGCTYWFIRYSFQYTEKFTSRGLVFKCLKIKILFFS